MMMFLRAYQIDMTWFGQQSNLNRLFQSFIEDFSSIAHYGVFLKTYRVELEQILSSIREDNMVVLETCSNRLVQWKLWAFNVQTTEN